MKKIEFKSQICTSIVQSKRLLKLGLKKETADILIRPDNTLIVINENSFIYHNLEKATQEGYFPSWSLGRLIKDLMPQSIGQLELAVGSDYAGYYKENLNKHKYNSELVMYWKYVKETPDMFDNIISTIEWLINYGCLNKDYLEERK